MEMGVDYMYRRFIIILVIMGIRFIFILFLFIGWYDIDIRGLLVKYKCNCFIIG